VIELVEITELADRTYRVIELVEITAPPTGRTG
jgi:hypothetical protein